MSRVAGRAALVPADGSSLDAKARNAKAAGAAALLVYGTALPAGALDADQATALPVLALPGETGAEAMDALREGRQVSAVLAPAGTVVNPGLDAVAGFSSGGLSFDGRVKPDVVAPGVGLATFDPSARRVAAVLDGQRLERRGRSRSGRGRTGRAGAHRAHRVRASRVLVGSAEPLGGVQPVTREGAGGIDPAAASTAELSVEPATVAFGRAGGADWSSSQTLTVKNLSSRPLEVGFGLVPDQPGPARVSFTAQPAHLSLGPGRVLERAAQRLRDGRAGRRRERRGRRLGPRRARCPDPVGDRAASGRPRARRFRQPVQLGVRAVEVSSRRARVPRRARRAGPGGEQIEPVGLLDLELWTPKGKRLGVIARLRDLLPGRYAFGLTGRGPDGKVLEPGTYVLRLRAQPVDAADGTPPSTADTVFRITDQ